MRERAGVRWYNDSIGSSPSRTIAGLNAFEKPVILIAGGYDKHIPYAPLGPVAAKTVKAAILMGATADAIEAAIRAHADLPIYRVYNMEEAVQKAAAIAGQGDIVFMSPASASFDLYPNFEVRGNHFKDLVQARLLFEKKGIAWIPSHRNKKTLEDLCRAGRRRRPFGSCQNCRKTAGTLHGRGNAEPHRECRRLAPLREK